jgi:hypothetical protein
MGFEVSVIGTIVLRCVHYALALAADDVETGNGPTYWRIHVVLLGDGMRVEGRARFAEKEMANLGAALEELLAGKRTIASLHSEDKAVYLSFDRRTDTEFGVAIRMMREAERGVYSAAETRTPRSQIEDFAARSKRFPY